MDIEESGGLEKYLEAEVQAAQDSRRRWKPEFAQFCKLAELYERLIAICRVPNKEETITAAKLLLVVQCQMYGVVSLMLRRRVTDAEALTRRAIEATGTAFLISRKPGLLNIYFEAYPNAGKIGNPKQWHPSDEYRNKFSTSALFQWSGETWSQLKSLYGMLSALSSHAGPGSIISHETKGKMVELQFAEPDNKTVRLAWNYLIDAYWEMLKVFRDIFKDNGDEAMRKVLAADMVSWRKTTGQVATERSQAAERIQPHPQ